MLICKDRAEFIATITEKMSKMPSGFYYFFGKAGTGKKYVLDKIETILKKDFKIYRLVSDAILEKKSKLTSSSLELSISFTLHDFIGLSLSVQKNDNPKVNYIINNLKKFSLKKNVLVSATDYDNLSSEARNFLDILIKYHKIIEEKTKKNIIIIITGISNFFFGEYNQNKVEFQDYTRKDLSYYLFEVLKYSPELLDNNKINQIHKLCGTNFSLVNSYSDIIIKDNNSNCSIEAIIDLKLNYYISAGCTYKISQKELEHILFLSSNSIHLLTSQMISSIYDGSVRAVNTGFQCAVDGNFLYKEIENSKYEHQNYYFVSNKEKNYLCQNIIVDKSNIAVQYYIYLSEYYEDEYFERALFLYRYFECINKSIFSLLILALSKSYLLNDTIARDKINSFLEQCNKDMNYSKVYFDVSKAYEEHYKMNFNLSSTKINNINFSVFNVVAAAEVRRLQFKNGQIGHIHDIIEMQCLEQQLEFYINNNKLILLSDSMFNQKEENLLSLKIIFDIAPYILDSKNDVENFNALYTKSLTLAKKIKDHSVRKSYAEYIINVFNRKAFLFAAPSVALLYYEEAEAYFRSNSILEELAITLASKAGMNISLQNYDSAINNCRQALKIIKENNLEILQQEKIYNNLWIAKFLDYEQRQMDICKMRTYTKKIIKKLDQLITNEANGKNHVILTNMASLFLYVNNDEEYLTVKRRIQNSLRCKDVSNIKDTTVNDFYRYHFAWFEFYRYLVKKNWEKCDEIINNLIEFYPSIFHNTKKMSLRIDAAKYLLNHHIVPSTRDYCLHFLEYATDSPEYISRGLLLSDLQFTSW